MCVHGVSLGTTCAQCDALITPADVLRKLDRITALLEELVWVNRGIRSQLQAPPRVPAGGADYGF